MCTVSLLICVYCAVYCWSCIDYIRIVAGVVMHVEQKFGVYLLHDGIESYVYIFFIVLL